MPDWRALDAGGAGAAPPVGPPPGRRGRRDRLPRGRRRGAGALPGGRGGPRPGLARSTSGTRSGSSTTPACGARRGAARCSSGGSPRCARPASSSPGAAALAALRFGLPQRASGGPISEAKILAAHREALAAAAARPGDPGLALRSIADRFDRTVRALELVDLDPALRSGVVADGLADLADGERHAVAVHAFDHGLADGLLGAVAAQLAEAYTLVQTPQGAHESLTARGVRHEAWLAVTQAVSGLPRGPEAATDREPARRPVGREADRAPRGRRPRRHRLAGRPRPAPARRRTHRPEEAAA